MSARIPLLVLIAVLAVLAVWWLFGSVEPQTPPASADATRQTREQPGRSVRADEGQTSPDVEEKEDAYVDARRTMIRRHLQGRDIRDRHVLAAIRRVPRHEFVPAPFRELAYADRALPIGQDQTISQPYIVALMTQLARPGPDSRALDIGTGSGYQAAVLAEIVREVYSIEILCPLAEEAEARLDRLGYDNVTVRCGDGYQGWKEYAPFDLIIVAAAPDHVPKPLVEQLRPRGRLVIPVGELRQELRVIEKKPDGSIEETTVAPVRFVPMTGQAREETSAPSP